MSDELKQAVTKRPQRRKIDLQTIEEVARLVATKISEAEACRVLGINPTSFYKFKCVHKHQQKWAAALDKFRGEKLKLHLDNVEQAAVGSGVHAKKGADWRASSWMVERALSSDGRYGDRVTTDSQTSVKIDVNAMFEIASKCYGGTAEVTATKRPPISRDEFLSMSEGVLQKVYAEPKNEKAIDVPVETRLLSERGEKP
jgi:hypothetical protein